jgi:hypothetical protein
MDYMRKAGERRLLIVLNLAPPRAASTLASSKHKLHCCFQPISIALEKGWGTSFVYGAMKGVIVELL